MESWNFSLMNVLEGRSGGLHQHPLETINIHSEFQDQPASPLLAIGKSILLVKVVFEWLVLNPQLTPGVRRLLFKKSVFRMSSSCCSQGCFLMWPVFQEGCSVFMLCCDPLKKKKKAIKAIKKQSSNSYTGPSAGEWCYIQTWKAAMNRELNGSAFKFQHVFVHLYLRYKTVIISKRRFSKTGRMCQPDVLFRNFCRWGWCLDSSCQTCWAQFA